VKGLSEEKLQQSYDGSFKHDGQDEGAQKRDHCVAEEGGELHSGREKVISIVVT
jgi:hypothetical protein